MRDQNHIVRGKKPSDLFDVFCYFLRKVLKIKAKWQRENLFFFYYFKKGFKYIKMD